MLLARLATNQGNQNNTVWPTLHLISLEITNIEIVCLCVVRFVRGMRRLRVGRDIVTFNQLRGCFKGDEPFSYTA
jgi:hypothetical protein